MILGVCIVKLNFVCYLYDVDIVGDWGDYL